MLEMFPYSFSGAVTSHSDPNMAPQDVNTKGLVYTASMPNFFLLPNSKTNICNTPMHLRSCLTRKLFVPSNSVVTGYCDVKSFSWKTFLDFFVVSSKRNYKRKEKKTQPGLPPLLCFALCILNNFVIILSKLLTPHIAYSREVQRKASLV